VLGADLPREIERLKRVTDGEIVVFGSSELLQTLAGYGLVDEYRLLVFPLILGTASGCSETGVR